MGARIGGGGRVSFRPSTPPPLEKNNSLSGGLFFATCSPCWSLFTWGSFFGLPPPPPYEHFCGRPILEYRYGIVTH